MQEMGGNEKSTGLVGRICERIHDWEFRHLWIARPCRYFALLAVVLGACYCAFNYFELYHTDADSARYLLSAMVQAQAAIVAIVITMTLIAVQLTASTYSPRVADVFRKNPDMWVLLGFYGISILYGFIVLKMVEGVGGDVVSQDVFWSHGFVSISPEICVSSAYWLEAFTLVALFPYIMNIIGLLKPENIINRLALEITKDKILNPKKDPIQPIMDIIHVSIVKYDIATVGRGLEAVMKKAAYIIDISKYSDDEYISIHFCGRLGTAGRCALRAGEDESAMEIIGCLNDIGTLAIEMRSDKSAKAAVQYIEMIGTVAAEKKLRFVACDTMESLKDVGMLAAKNQLGDLTLQAIDSLGNVGMYAADNKIEIAAQDAAKYLGCVGKCAAENELENATKQAANSLGVVGEYAAESKLENATAQVIVSFGAVGKAAAEKGLEDAVKQAAWSLGAVGTAAAEKELDDAAWQSAGFLEVVGTAAAEKGLDDAVWQAAWSLGAVGTAAAEKRLKRVALRAVLSLEVVGTTAAAAGTGLEHEALRAVLSLEVVGTTAAAAEKELEEVVWQAACSLGVIGTAAVEEGLKDAAKQAAESLAELTISSEEITKNAIQNYESQLEEQDRDSFQKFMLGYKQELEKLRDLVRKSLKTTSQKI